jgi:methionyl-tRNA synthetase
MIDQKKKFYVTTPIYYVTAKPHLGSLYSTLLADVAARWHKLRGYDTFFLTGTDEHGQKVAEAAAKASKEPQEFVDSFIDNYKDMWHKYEIEYNDFIRTTDKSHVKAVQEWLKRLIDSGDIYKSYYTGYYCTPCETFVTDKDASLQASGAEEPVCTSCSRITVAVSEESYFFKLSAYQKIQILLHHVNDLTKY